MHHDPGQRRRSGHVKLLRIPVLPGFLMRQREYAVADLAERTLRLCDTGTVAYLEASHWLQDDERARVGELIREFLAVQPG